MSEIKYYYYPEVRPKFDNKNMINKGTVTQDQINARCSKFDKEDADREVKQQGWILRKQLEEEKKKNSELQKTVDSLSFMVWSQYNRINDLNDSIRHLREFPNQGINSQRK